MKYPWKDVVYIPVILHFIKITDSKFTFQKHSCIFAQNSSMKKSNINIEVVLDNDQHPHKIFWEATDNPYGEKKTEVKAMLVSFFDKEYKDTYKIDLWTNEMEVSEMDRFMFQTIKALADTYYKATNNAQLASAMQSLADYIGKETGIIPQEEDVD